MKFYSESPGPDADTPAVVPVINADGTLGDETHSMLRQHRRGVHTANFVNVLTRTGPLPEQVFMSYTEFIRDDLTDLVDDDVRFVGWAATIPALAVGAILNKLSVNGIASVLIGASVVPAAMLFVLWRAYWRKAQFWEEAIWLDMVERKWKSRKHYLDSRRADELVSMPFESLGLLYFATSLEQGASHDVVVCKLAGWPETSIHHRPNTLSFLFSSDSGDEALECIGKLSAQLGLDAWVWTGGMRPELEKIHPTPAEPKAPPPVATAAAKVKHGTKPSSTTGRARR